ncbi:DciA family protein [Streptomyces sp. CJ_13]|uniref:DciA family protein n=1 Tax=Streptomyces sp. CJ_13 TaxID=2724943 RepID=UPI00202A8A99|nr:DciA family protein [Streptomyces sp. CJ_13]
MADRAWDPRRGRRHPGPWPDIADAVTTNLSAHVTAAAFNAENGQLDLRPGWPAYATQLRLLNARIIATVNDRAGTQAVRTIRVLADGQSTAPAPRTPTPAPAAATGPEAPARTRDMAPAGFHRALAAHQAVPRRREMAVDIEQAAARQTQCCASSASGPFPTRRSLPTSSRHRSTPRSCSGAGVRRHRDRGLAPGPSRTRPAVRYSSPPSARRPAPHLGLIWPGSACGRGEGTLRIRRSGASSHESLRARRRPAPEPPRWWIEYGIGAARRPHRAHSGACTITSRGKAATRESVLEILRTMPSVTAPTANSASSTTDHTRNAGPFGLATRQERYGSGRQRAGRIRQA